MDHQNRVGSRHGAGMASAAESNVDRRARLTKLAMETIDIRKEPYILKNHLGGYECKLCLTLHTNEGSYLAHTQGKKHQMNLARRAAKDGQNNNGVPIVAAPTQIVPKRNIIKIGRPGYKVTKICDPATRQLGLFFQVQYPEIKTGVVPRHRFMSAYEQKIEPPNRAYQYLLIAAEPYEIIAYRVQNREVEKVGDKFWAHWDPDARIYTIQVFFGKSVVT